MSDADEQGSSPEAEDSRVVAAVTMALFASKLKPFSNVPEIDSAMRDIYRGTCATIVAVIRDNPAQADILLLDTQERVERLRSWIDDQDEEEAAERTAQREAKTAESDAGRREAFERQAQRAAEIVQLRAACSPTLTGAEGERSPERAASCVAYGKRLEYPYSPSAREVEEQVHAFEIACDLGNMLGCYEHVRTGRMDRNTALVLVKKACRAGVIEACQADFGCVEQHEVAVAGQRVSSNSMRVTQSVGLASISKCEQLCGSGLAGACLTAARYYSSAGNDEKAKAAFARACASGNKPSCP